MEIYIRYVWETEILIKRQFWFKAFGVCKNNLINFRSGNEFGTYRKLNLDKNNVARRKTFNKMFYAANHFFPYSEIRKWLRTRGGFLKFEHRQKIYVDDYRIHFIKFNDYRYN